jgi:hypothetical protein
MDTVARWKGFVEINHCDGDQNEAKFRGSPTVPNAKENIENTS